MTYYIAGNGNDEWSGTLAAPDPGGSDGPFATFDAASRAVIKLGPKDGAAEPVLVVIREGTYEVEQPLIFGLETGGSPAPVDDWNRETGPECSITWAAYEDEQVTLSAGTRLNGWEKGSLNGQEAWVATVPWDVSGDGYFTQAFVDGERAKRSRLPESGLFKVAEPLGTVLYDAPVNDALFTGQDSFRFNEGDLKDWTNVGDVEFVGLHYWIESRIPFTQIDTEQNVASLARKTRMRMTDDFETDGAPFYVENVKEAVVKPGQWYLDRPTNTIYYIPRAGQKPETTEIIVPRLERIVEVTGSSREHVGHIRFQGITFSHTEYTPGPEAETATPQAACHVPGAVLIAHAHDVVFSHCAFVHLGGYGVEITDGSHDIAIESCEIRDLGAGGVKVFHSYGGDAPMPGTGPDWNHTDTCRRILITDNQICDGGYRAHQAVGVLVGRCSGVQILHNHIHDFDYTGVSVGWTWGYEDGEAYGNIVEYNHIHHIGRGMLSDMGGIYTLGVQPGTRLRYNHIHDVCSRGYGGWGIYNDEGSSYILIENNLVYRTKSNGYNQHYGRENIVRNNIFAAGGEAQISRSRFESHDSFVFTHNVVYSDSTPEFLAGDWKETSATLDRNIYWYSGTETPLFAGNTFEEWQKRDVDVNSVYADPQFRDPDHDDFVLAPDSPAVQLGFIPFDLSNAGPRG